MGSWRVDLRVRSEGWYWECFDAAGNFVCRSRQVFRHCWQAFRDFDRMIEDHWALMQSRF